MHVVVLGGDGLPALHRAGMDLRGEPGQLLQEHVGPEAEHPRVPVVAARLDHLRGRLQRRLLGKACDPIADTVLQASPRSM